ncbi:MAG: CpsB/CapC family capsule biosynthesis tyrosine phosphatase [Ginsengibacter sp.]
MFNIFKKKEVIKFEGFSWLFQDIHSHLLPGLDDGSPDMETSILLLKSLHEAGISKFICTPHIIGDMYRNTPETINAALNKLKNAVQDEGMDIQLSAAAEYMLDDYFLELIRKNQRLLTLEENYILTELPYFAVPVNLKEITFEILTNNYQPLMAHPERYHYYHKDYAAYSRLKEMGFLLQVNVLSLTGYYGKEVARAAQYIVKNNLASFVGSDLHHSNHLAALTDERSVRTFEKYLGHKVFNNFSG